MPRGIRCRLARAVLAASGLACLASPLALAASASVQERVQACLHCHGSGGRSETPGIPSLAAQPSGYLMTQLFLFREKLRRVDVMNLAASPLSDEDLQQFADYLTALAAPAAPADAADPVRMQRAGHLVRQFHCRSCHGEHFEGHDSIPRLAGQREEYLARALREFKANVRPGYDATMAEVVQPIDEAQISDLAYLLAHSP